MKERILTLALCAAAVPCACAATGETMQSPGKVMFVGDSITHGINTGSYRWDFHKILVDNGVKYEETGYNSNNFKRGKGNGVNLAAEKYRGVPFQNRHSAHEGGQIWQLFQEENTAYTQPGTGMEFKTASGVKYAGQTIGGLVKDHRANTYVVLLGTNDIIQNFHKGGSISKQDNLQQALLGILGTGDKGGSFSGRGTMDTLVDAMLQGAATRQVIVMGLIPPGRTQFAAADHAAIVEFNKVLETWAQQKGVRYVAPGPGTVDVAATPADPYGALVSPQQRVDWIHPGPQTNLIMAGNLAKALGCPGRTAGLPRKAAGKKGGFSCLHKAGEDASWSGSLKTAGDGSVTVELAAPRVGNGYTDNKWNTQDCLSLSIDTGKHRGTLNICESYITWGKDFILYSRDMSTNKEPLRVAYVNGKAADGVAPGFYVWLGNQLIGEACAAETGSGTPGISAAYSGQEGCKPGAVHAAPKALAPAAK
ncbi:MAG: GDSL-type esterase/lipase family protein [Akkermansia sp.]|nr:GDSL-type esterase/lipase family protein [Akkermansia sp.]